MYTLEHKYWADYMNTHYPHEEWHVLKFTTTGRELMAVCYNRDDAHTIVEALISQALT